MIDPIHYLEESRDAMATYCRSLDPEAALKPYREGGWSADNFLEHLATVERGVLIGLKKGPGGDPASPEDLAATQGKSEFILTHVPLGERRIEAPEAVRPVGRYGAWPASFEAFLNARAALLAFARTTPGEALEALVMPHPGLGPLTGTQWLYFCAAHVDRHRLQLESGTGVV